MVSQGRARGHLSPLQERFLKSTPDSLHQQEIIELLASLCLPCINCVPQLMSQSCSECRKQAEECANKLKKFGTLREILSANPHELEEAGILTKAIIGIKLLHELPAEVLKEKIIKQPVSKSSGDMFNYLNYSMRDLKKEVFKVIYLNNRNQIIEVADLFEGTLESIHIHPREIVESAIRHQATAVIFAHNHPAGDPTPSKSDKQLTRDLVFIGMILQIKVLDHIVIGADTYFSFADEGLIQKYEDEFLNLRIRGAFDSRKFAGATR